MAKGSGGTRGAKSGSRSAASAFFSGPSRMDATEGSKRYIEVGNNTQDIAFKMSRDGIDYIAVEATRGGYNVYGVDSVAGARGKELVLDFKKTPNKNHVNTEAELRKIFKKIDKYKK